MTAEDTEMQVRQMKSAGVGRVGRVEMEQMLNNSLCHEGQQGHMCELSLVKKKGEAGGGGSGLKVTLPTDTVLYLLRLTLAGWGQS